MLIDFDGVLVDSTMAYMKATEVALKRFNFPGLIEEEVKETALEIARRLDLGYARSEILEGMISLTPDRMTEFMDVWLKTWNEVCLWEVRPFTGVHYVLAKLSNRFPLALVTLRFLKKNLIEDQLKRLRLKEFFKAIITTLDVKRPKPDPESFLEGARRLKVAIADCGIIGDSVLDIRAGKAAGAKTIAVLTGIFEEDALKTENPDLVLQRMTEILPYLK